MRDTSLISRRLGIRRDIDLSTFGLTGTQMYWHRAMDFSPFLGYSGPFPHPPPGSLTTPHVCARPTSWWRVALTPHNTAPQSTQEHNHPSTQTKVPPLISHYQDHFNLASYPLHVLDADKRPCLCWTPTPSFSTQGLDWASLLTVN